MLYNNITGISTNFNTTVILYYEIYSFFCFLTDWQEPAAVRKGELSNNFIPWREKLEFDWQRGLGIKKNL